MSGLVGVPRARMLVYLPRWWWLAHGAGSTATRDSLLVNSDYRTTPNLAPFAGYDQVDALQFGSSIPIAGVGPGDMNRWLDGEAAMVAAMFEEDDMGQFEGFAGDGKTAFQAAVRQVLNEGTAFGQTSWAETEEATLGAVQSLTVLVKQAQGTLAGNIVDLRSALLGAIAAQPAMSDEQAQAAADRLIAAARQEGVELVRDAVVEAFRLHPLTPTA